MLILVDIDGVLTLESEGWGKDYYPYRTPNFKAIGKINRLVDLGHMITLFTARYVEDKQMTEEWLVKYNVKYTNIMYGRKPVCNVMIDDKAIPTIPEDLEKYLSYNFHNSCWRFKHGFISPDEKHPCFFCGFQIDISVMDCPKCGIMPCPKCGKCLCNIPLLTYITLIRIHEKYCCNLPEFDGKIKLSGFVDNDLICNCEKTLSYCKSLEKI